MCMQCFTKALVWRKEILPGYKLMLARQDYQGIRRGMYGLVRSNDPDVVWEVEPITDPLAGVDTAELEDNSILWKQDSNFMQAVAAFSEWLRIDPAALISGQAKGLCIEVAYNIVDACIRSGYNKEQHGLVASWLLNHIAIFLQHEQDTIDVADINAQGNIKIHS